MRRAAGRRPVRVLIQVGCAAHCLMAMMEAPWEEEAARSSRTGLQANEGVATSSCGHGSPTLKVPRSGSVPITQHRPCREEVAGRGPLQGPLTGLE